MIVYVFNLVNIAVLPVETDAPLVVDFNAVLTLSASGQFLQVI
jgi:hypothetical protein